MDKDLYRLPFEIECHRQKDELEFCRVFFTPKLPLPKRLLFGMDGLHLTPYEQFIEDNAGMVVNRADKLIVFIKNKRTGRATSLAIDLEPYWPADLGPGEMKASLAEIDITAAIAQLS